MYERDGDRLVWREAAPQATVHLEVAVADGAVGRFVAGLTVHIEVEQDGRTLIRTDLPFLWHPFLYHYGTNAQISAPDRTVSPCASTLRTSCATTRSTVAATPRRSPFYAGTDDLDAATLLAGQTGFDRGERLAGTIAAIRNELADGPLLYRYTGMRKEEGTFLACSFWLVSALTSLGRHQQAAAQMKAAVTLTTDLGLLAEQINPADRSMLGNLPQALSHLALINAAFALRP
ncbi:hypothetical protein ACIA5C_20435 [Actinoplanes sp. NPDC051343]|uniref:hypothetical protein n=1 Tax=Actinoplanes sp. NPDC051343 TaxID=3363906 RepID=UPI0037954269